MNEHLLLRGGTVLHHDVGDNVVILSNTDILVEDGRVIGIGQELVAKNGASIIDCQNKIVAPGFINAHHHTWQSQLKGRLGDCTMLDYMLEGRET